MQDSPPKKKPWGRIPWGRIHTSPLQQIPARMLKGELGERLACSKGAITKDHFGADFGVLHAAQAQVSRLAGESKARSEKLKFL